jgi:hypothetical protein
MLGLFDKVDILADFNPPSSPLASKSSKIVVAAPWIGQTGAFPTPLKHKY